MTDSEGGGDDRWWWWAAASSAQLAVGIAWYRRGLEGSGLGMPFKAFAIATLFVGAGASAAGTALLASGVESGEDLKEVGLGIRRRLMHESSPRTDHQANN